VYQSEHTASGQQLFFTLIACVIQVGHVLNMMHDDNRLCRANFDIDARSHVMSSTMDRVDSAQPWSLCSKQAVLDFLQEGRGECLLDVPSQPKVRC